MLSSPRFRAGPLPKLGHAIRDRLPEVNFITIHYTYFIVTSLLSALIFWGAATPFKSVSFTDALFLCSSAMTEAGLNTINLSQLNTFQQTMLFLLILAGSTIFVSAFIVFVRLNAFEKEFRTVIKRRREEKRLKRAGTDIGRVQALISRKGRHPTTESQQQQTLAPVAEHTGREKSDKAPLVLKTGTEPQQESNGPSNGEAITSSIEDNQRDHEHSAALRFDGPTDNAEKTPVSPVPFSPSVDRGSRSLHRFNTVATRRSVGGDKSNRQLISFAGVGSTGDSHLRRRPTATFRPELQRAQTLRGHPTDPWLSSKLGYVARNSQFSGLSFEERQQLGGYEYSAILFLSFIVPLYFVAWQLLGCIALGAYVQNNRAHTARANGLNPFWVGAFNAVSAFNNSGMSLLDANMIAFQNSVFMLLSMGLFILAGNTAYPIFLRMAIWSVWKVLPDDDVWGYEKKTMRFLLDHPRRCYTNLFPLPHTWWLGLTLVVLNGIDWAAFGILNIGNTHITSLGPGLEVIDGLFQSLAVRAGGFYVVPIPSVRISLQVLYVVMMYISAYPVVISMRNSNVYEEKSLGIFAEDQPEDEPPAASSERFSGLKRHVTGLANASTRESKSYFVRHQLRAQLAHDIWWLVLAIFLIMIIEGGRFESDPVHFSVFNVIFEVVSGYASVGISVGVPHNAYSFSGSWSVLSKLIMVAVMIRGRHRGLPVAIDHAVRLPGAKMYEDEENEDVVRGPAADTAAM